MEMKFVDSNIFLELMLDDEKSEQCRLFFEKLKNKEIEARTSDFIIYSCLLQIQYKIKSLKHMKNFILFINEMKGLKIIRPSLEELYNAIVLGERYNLDFDDSLVISVMIKNDIKTILSFDKHFDKVTVVKREEP